MRNRVQSGFTLTELMIVVALLGILTAIAVAASSGGKDRSRGFADQMAGELETARLRALASRRWHRITFTPTGATLDQSTTTGMALPTAYQTVGLITAPAAVRIVAMANTTLLAPTTEPAAGSGLAGEIVFAPDGTSVARTLWVSDRQDYAPYRIALFGATGHARVYEGW